MARLASGKSISVPMGTAIPQFPIDDRARQGATAEPDERPRLEQLPVRLFRDSGGGDPEEVEDLAGPGDRRAAGRARER